MFEWLERFVMGLWSDEQSEEELVVVKEFEERLRQAASEVAGIIKTYPEPSSDASLVRLVKDVVVVLFRKHGWGELESFRLTVTIDPERSGGGVLAWNYRYKGPLPLSPTPPEMLRQSWRKPAPHARLEVH